MVRFLLFLCVLAPLLMDPVCADSSGEEDSTSVKANAGTPPPFALPLAKEDNDSSSEEEEVIPIPFYQLTAPQIDQETAAPEIAALSLDGGGVRGYFQALILYALEEEFRRCLGVSPETLNAEKPRLIEAFDLVGGTSAGAIGAACLTVSDPTGMRPLHDLSKLLEFYEGDGRDEAGALTYADPPVAGMFRRSLWQKAKSLFGLRREKYSSGPLQRALSSYGLDVPLTTACVPTLIVTAQLRDDADGSRPVHLKSYEMGDFPSVTSAQAALCSGAAPTYFKRVHLEGDAGPGYFVDGGVTGANNPSVVLIPEIFRMRHGLRNRNLLLVSVGTGVAPVQINGRRAAKFGLVKWAKPVISLSLGMPTLTNEDTMDTLFRKKGAERAGGYMRWSPRLESKIDLDDASPGNLALMRTIATAFLEERQEEIQETAQKLARRYRVKQEKRAHGVDDRLTSLPMSASFSAFSTTSPAS